jgi:predicted lipid-binding transport protein (Tim44 family)
MSVVRPEERTTAAALTNAARYTLRPAGPMLGGLLQSLTIGLPLVVAGVVKGGYDLALWTWAKRENLAMSSLHN